MPEDVKSVWTKDSNGHMEEYRVYEGGDVYKVEHNLFLPNTTTKVGSGSNFQNGLELAKSDSGGKVHSIDDL